MIAAVCGTMWLLAASGAWGAPLSSGSVSASRELIRQAAAALGGSELIEATRNITLAGYGQYAYMFGGGRISPSPDAPEKYIAANDLRRVYDLEHARFQQRERRNMLFPFLAGFGHSYALNSLVLDGDIAYDAPPDKAPLRIARWVDGALQEDGVHMRRMWGLNNPVALIRKALQPDTMLGAPRRDGNLAVIDLTLREGDKLSVGLHPNHLPAWIRWSNPHTNLGEVTFTTYWTGYASIGGLMLPLGYDTRLDWRNIDYLKIYVDHYEINSNIDDLAAPPAVREAPEPPSYAVIPVTSVPVAPHLWRIDQGGTTVVEFKDHLTLFELGVNVHQAKAVIEYARTLVPGKPVTELITTHNHFDHLAGLREAVALGLTVIARRDNEGFFNELAQHADTDFPDDLARAPKPLKFRPVDEHLRLADDTMTLDIYWSRKNIHTVEQVFAYAPNQKVIMEGDIATAAYDYQFWPDDFDDLIEYYRLEPQLLSPVHSISREHPNVLTMSQVEELIKGGTQRARARCDSELAKGNYFPGCPVWSKRY